MDPLQRLRNEVYICSILHHGGVEAVPLVGVYSTERHPCGLVYEYMDNLDLRQHLGNEPSVMGLKLVPIPMHPLLYYPPTL